MLSNDKYRVRHLRGSTVRRPTPRPQHRSSVRLAELIRRRFRLFGTLAKDGQGSSHRPVTARRRRDVVPSARERVRSRRSRRTSRARKTRSLGWESNPVRRPSPAHTLTAVQVTTTPVKQPSSGCRVERSRGRRASVMYGLFSSAKQKGSASPAAAPSVYLTKTGFRGSRPSSRPLAGPGTEAGHTLSGRTRERNSGEPRTPRSTRNSAPAPSPSASRVPGSPPPGPSAVVT